MKKFSFTGETKIYCGITLNRIKAEISFGIVVKGEIGGWLEKEGNLNQSSDAWVSGDARVFGNARVYGDARVYDDAQVYGDARVYDDARVYGDARVSDNTWVYGNARVSDNAQVYDNARVHGDAQVYSNARVYGDARVHGDAWLITPLCIHTTKFSVCISSKTKISIGCETYTPKEWDKIGERIAKNNDFTKTEIEEYKLYIDLCKRWLKLYCS
uniref:Polymer-forming cytoskeletal protein n=2 Tax=viral metagenome TaxID=1070528 RepID=A0A6M3K680_9ZZZZ